MFLDGLFSKVAKCEITTLPVEKGRAPHVDEPESFAHLTAAIVADALDLGSYAAVAEKLMTEEGVEALTAELERKGISLQMGEGGTAMSQRGHEGSS